MAESKKNDTANVEDMDTKLEGLKSLLLKSKLIQRFHKQYRHSQTDCYVISYPKSGRTWLRVMLAKALAVYFNDPRPIVYEPAAVVRKGGHKGPHIRFEHNGSDRTPEIERKLARKRHHRFQTKRIIFLARDPRDVVVSYFFHRTRRMGESYTLSDFIRHPWWGIERTINFMNSWAEDRETPKEFLLVRYDDLHQNTEIELHKILNFLGLSNVSNATLRAAVEYAHLENLRKLSVSELNSVDRMAPTNPQDLNSYKIRRGVVGGYVNYMSPDDIVYVDSKIHGLSSFFNYS